MGLVYAGGECFTDDNPCPSAATVQEQANENSAALAAVGPGGVVWQEEYPSSDDPAPILPLYTTSDGGTVVTSSQKTPPDITYGQFSLGTLYTLDQNGNITSQTADSGAVISWTGNWYADPSGFVSALFQSPILTNSLWAFLGGDPSGTGVAKRPWYFILNWQNEFDFIPSNPGPPLTNLKTDITGDTDAIKTAAFEALKKAYHQTTKQWPVTVIKDGTAGSGDSTAIVQDTAPNDGDCGDTTTNQIGPKFTSFVSYECAMSNAQFALGIKVYNSQEEAAALQRQDLIQAIGRGIGNIAAHEIAHQYLVGCCGMDATDDAEKESTYNQAVLSFDDISTGFAPDGTAIKWGNATQQGLNRCLDGGWVNYGFVSCAAKLDLGSGSNSGQWLQGVKQPVSTRLETKRSSRMRGIR